MGTVSWDETENASTNEAAETSKTGPNPLPEGSRTARESIVRYGAASAFTAARLAAVSVKETVAESALVPSSAADSVVPAAGVPGSLMWNLAASMLVASIVSSKVISSAPVPRSSVAEENAGAVPS